MTMRSPAHPEPERLAALAGRDPDAVADHALAAHLADCQTCVREVRELSAIRLALSELPDLAPPRPLQLVPPIPPPASRWTIVMRRAFAPLAVAGMVLILVGGVGASGALGSPDAGAFLRQLLPAAQAPAEAPGYETDSGAEVDGGGAPQETMGTSGLAPSPAPRGSDETPQVTGGESDRADDLGVGAVGQSGWIAMILLGAGILALAFVLRRFGGARRPLGPA